MKSLWRLPPETYKNLAVRCAPGVHEAACALITSHVPMRGAVLDLAAGTGSWLARINDAGFKELTAVELDLEEFKLEGVKPRPIDLNSLFSKEFDSSFQLVTAIEIIEHLDCPRAFLREIHQLLCPGGYLLLTTPNIGHWAGRLRFLLWAEHRYFKESDYHEQRHISPVSHIHMCLMFREIGYKLIAHRTAGTFFTPLKKIVTAGLSLPFQVLFGSNTDGDANIYLAQKTDPDVTLTGKDSYYFKK
ncbi:MAG: class I SAM-dependent methyltransferase [Gomphosphaeria aponina SAG 52.96 = DSM 107014]|uniref:Class I SAM-dependent methyltransferase n=1 Tax=Gomphosphaeria aponina SAG 52.96 = DSM 107014 TaxID=1521640 RepID=A0A941GRE2_9CHRO|nr:class I SAM-dependent methyltransferase [Gomphosphaeria aponina SAG 52.96 = DSM 107014]